MYFLLFLCCFVTIFCDEITVQPQGEYATIDVKRSNEAINILMSNQHSLAEKVRTADLVQQNAGSYDPWALLALGLFRLSEDRFTDAVQFIRAAEFRIVVDTKISQDPRLDDVIEIAFEQIRNATQKYVNTPAKKEAWEKALTNADANLEQWDRNTPRNYDERWIDLHSIKAFSREPIKKMSNEDKNKIIEEEYRLFKKGTY